ncbi:DUF1853 family protein [Christiangramia sp. SM2212]|uniref:DUF1853 family protein n=1 Tax=Christiangramia sediminicola TaxID=3073267 RepID=A0ABU1EPQ5_9FLAO|nr:DUF1853 family protein [Christiangramia sp. SM2212]MDR5590365.1 DUF1853 family protein [Christiangramia sp. SM2212]
MEGISIIDQFQGFLNTPDIFPDERDLKTFQFPDVNLSEALLLDLEELDHPRNSVLGKRMESFFEIAIKHSERYDLIASNIQIIENKQTLGELDFLVFDKEISKTVHVELVYKLYVYDESLSNERDKWIGPNRRDSFSEKLEKLRSKQFPLLYKPETSHYLKKLGLNKEDIQQQLCFKAQLFTADNLNFSDQKTVNPDCYKGHYVRLSDFIEENNSDSQFHSPKKKYWSCDPTNNSEWMNKQELLNNIEQLIEKEKAPLVWKRSGSAFQSFFIVWW